MTGLLDTQTDLARLALPSLPAPPIPVSLRETRHRIVHRHLPSLPELKRAADESLAWLWEHYWSHFDALLAVPQGDPQLSGRELRERFQNALKTYVKERKAEIKSRKKDARAADGAVGNYLSLPAPRHVKVAVLLELLVQEKTILPVGKKLGTSMEGAYLIWTPFLADLSSAEPTFLPALTQRMVDVLSSPSRGGASVEEDPAREGMHDWLLHILISIEWHDIERRGGVSPLLDDVLGSCFTAPTFWTLKLAEYILASSDVPGRKSWVAILEAARREEDGNLDEQLLPPKLVSAPGDMDVDTIVAEMPVSDSTSVKKIRGPQRYPGLWRPQPIGWIPPGWVADRQTQSVI